MPRSHWSAVPTLVFDNISQLLRDSFSISEQPPSGNLLPIIPWSWPVYVPPHWRVPFCSGRGTHFSSSSGVAVCLPFLSDSGVKKNNASVQMSKNDYYSVWLLALRLKAWFALLLLNYYCCPVWIANWVSAIKLHNRPDLVIYGVFGQYQLLGCRAPLLLLGLSTSLLQIMNLAQILRTLLNIYCNL